MAQLTRRTLTLAALGAGLGCKPALAAASFAYKGWAFDTSELKTDLAPALIKSFQDQIDIVEGLAIKPDIKTFFRSIPCRIDLTTPGGPGAYSFDRHRMLLSTTPQPPENPVFLHELLHGYHDQRLPGGVRNGEVIKVFDQARASNQFPPQAYMLTKPTEFFAMCASVVLWGKAARPPATRANVKRMLPDTYAFIVRAFGFQEA